MEYNIYVAVHVPSGTLCLIAKHILSSIVTFDGVSLVMTCEIGPISEFELLEPLYSEAGLVHHD